MYRVLFVCLGNICRSPLADGVLAHKLQAAGLAETVTVDSCGTGGYHVGAPPHHESIRVAEQHGVPLAHLRARQVAIGDFDTFDRLVAMDRQNYQDLLALEATGQMHDKVSLFMSYVPGATSPDVPDPYFGGPEGFDAVYAMVDAGCETLVAEIRQTLAATGANGGSTQP
jgi:protein-tyrosine phosphatase